MREGMIGSGGQQRVTFIHSPVGDTPRSLPGIACAHGTTGISSIYSEVDMQIKKMKTWKVLLVEVVFVEWNGFVFWGFVKINYLVCRSTFFPIPPRFVTLCWVIHLKVYIICGQIVPRTFPSRKRFAELYKEAAKIRLFTAHCTRVLH